MAGSRKTDITGLLNAWNEGNPGSLDDLMDQVYRELKRMAAVQMRREGAGHTLQPTALVHEVFLRLIDQDRIHWKGRAQFFRVAGQMMRRILVDHARRRRRTRRGGGAVHLSLEVLPEPVDVRSPEQILALDEALSRLAGFDPRRARVVELHFLVGLSVAETASALECSQATVSRDWNLARAWLVRELERGVGYGS